MGKKEESLVGKILESYNYGKFEVLRRIGNKSPILYEVRFLDTGTVDIFRKANIVRGKIKDVYRKTVCGVGCIGKASKVKNKKEYDLWNSMLLRCYQPTHGSYASYGAKGVTVCERWLCFEYFLEDLPKIEGYNEKDFYEGKISLDKDFKQQGKPPHEKVYSLETCCFLPNSINFSLTDKSKTIKKIVAANVETGEEIFIENIRQYALSKELNQSLITKSLKSNGEYVYKGYKYYYLNDYNNNKKEER
jgi:hypothetical protein